MRTPLAGALALLLFASPVHAHDERFTLDCRDVALPDVIRLLGTQAGRNVVADASVKPVRVSIRLRDVTFDEALRTVLEAYGLRPRYAGSILIVGEAGGTVRTGAESAPVAVPLQNARATEVVKALHGAVPDAAFLADDRQNVVVLGGTQEQQAAARGLLRRFDEPSRQVMFEVRVADVQPLQDRSNVGIQFGGPGYGAGALAQFPFAVTRSALAVNAQINALVEHGRASILAEPRVATLNNHEASLLIGEQYPVVTVNQQTGFPSVQTIDIGVRLRVTPTIGGDGTITADLHPEFSAIIGFNGSFPIIANRKVDATLRVRDGETIVLAGLFQDVDSETVTKLPVLGDLPVLGGVFRNRQRTRTRDEVVFFITPHVMPSDGG